MQELVAKGVRITAQRRILIETIQDAKRHIDAPTLLGLARQRDASTDRATAYRTINLLRKHGLIDELEVLYLTGEKRSYEVKTHRDEVCLACVRCGKIEDMTPPFFEKPKGEMARQSGFEIKTFRLEIGGLCKVCELRDRTPK